MKLFGFGANSHGQLGTGSCSEFEHLTEIHGLPEEISTVCAGSGHSIIIGKSDDNVWSVFVAGRNNKGQLGINSIEDTYSFKKMSFDHNFRKVSCGWDNSAGITDKGRLFVWGSNAFGQLGFSSKLHKSILRPVELFLPQGEKAKDIQFGLRHSAILTDSKKVFIVGSLRNFKSSNHQIIVHNDTEFLQPLISQNIVQISSGQNHVIYLDDSNRIQGIGDNKYNQCIEVSHHDKIIQLGSGWTHNGFLNRSKELYLYGRNNYGQLGCGSKDEYSSSPRKCLIEPVTDFQLGSEHGILTSNSHVYSWGWNEHMNCGNGSEKDV